MSITSTHNTPEKPTASRPGPQQHPERDFHSRWSLLVVIALFLPLFSCTPAKDKQAGAGSPAAPQLWRFPSLYSLL